MGLLLLFLSTLVTGIFGVGIYLMVSTQTHWEAYEASAMSEVQRETKRKNYRLIVGVLVGTYLLFLGTAVYMFFVLKDLNLL